jgi:hypothetical protein
MNEPIVSIIARPGLCDTETKQPVQKGDIVWIAGYILPNGELCAETVAIEKSDDIG